MGKQYEDLQRVSSSVPETTELIYNSQMFKFCLLFSFVSESRLVRALFQMRVVGFHKLQVQSKFRIIRQNLMV